MDEELDFLHIDSGSHSAGEKNELLSYHRTDLQIYNDQELPSVPQSCTRSPTLKAESKYLELNRDRNGNEPLVSPPHMLHHSQPSCPKPRLWTFELILTWVCIIVILATCIVIRLTLSAIKENPPFLGLGNASTKVKESNCLEELKNEFETGVQPSIFQQCDCITNIPFLQQEIILSYNGIKNNLDPVLNISWDHTSCDQRNKAMVWLAVDLKGKSFGTFNLDRYILTLLYLVWNGDVWRQKSGWLSSDSICNWYGVECNDQFVAMEVVSTLHLAGNELRGTIPSEIVLFQSLYNLTLSFNQLSGSIPSQIGLLSFLVQLDLSKNSLSGEIPSTISGIKTLSALDLSFNRLTGGIPTEIRALSRLSSLAVNVNILKATLPTEIGSLTSLQILNMEECLLLGDIPKQIGDLKNLQFLSLARNSLTSLPSEIGGLLELRKLFLSVNFGLKSLPSELGRLSNLVSLSVAYSDLYGTIPSEIGSLSKLTFLDLKNNNLQGSIPGTILSLEKLKILKLQYNQLSGSILFLNSSFPKCIDVTKTSISLLEGNCDLMLDGEMILIASCLYEIFFCSCCGCAYEGIDACDKYIEHDRNLY